MKIHRYWHGDPHPLEDWIRTSVRTTHYGHELCDWDARHLSYPAGDARHDSNVLRYEALLLYGGLWLDHDVVPLRNLVTLHTEPWTASIKGRYEGCVMFFPEPNHPALKVLLRKAREAAPDWSSPRRSGAQLLNSVLPDYRIRKEPRVLPFDARGRATGVGEPYAFHAWDSSSRAYQLKAPLVDVTVP